MKDIKHDFIILVSFNLVRYYLFHRGGGLDMPFINTDDVPASLADRIVDRRDADVSLSIRRCVRVHRHVLTFLASPSRVLTVINDSVHWQCPKTSSTSLDDKVEPHHVDYAQPDCSGRRCCLRLGAVSDVTDDTRHGRAVGWIEPRQGERHGEPRLKVETAPVLYCTSPPVHIREIWYPSAEAE
jgi:hypothetical protein